jgi:hypothetical protein
MARNTRSSKRGRRPAARLVIGPAAKRVLCVADDAASLAVPIPAVSRPQGAGLGTGQGGRAGGRKHPVPAALPPRDGGRRTLQGRIERVDRTGIAGWVWDAHAPGERIRLELAEGNRRLAEIVAEDDRPDLVPLGCNDGRHGFTLALRDARLSDGRHVLTLRCAATGAEMPGSPIVVEYRAAAPPPPPPAIGVAVPSTGSAANGPPVSGSAAASPPLFTPISTAPRTAASRAGSCAPTDRRSAAPCC